MIDRVRPAPGSASFEFTAWRIRHVTSVSRSTLPIRSVFAVLLHQEEPVAAPGDVAGHATEPIDFDHRAR